VGGGLKPVAFAGLNGGSSSSGVFFKDFQQISSSSVFFPFLFFGVDFFDFLL